MVGMRPGSKLSEPSWCTCHDSASAARVSGAIRVPLWTKESDDPKRSFDRSDCLWSVIVDEPLHTMGSMTTNLEASVVGETILN